MLLIVMVYTNRFQLEIAIALANIEKYTKDLSEWKERGTLIKTIHLNVVNITTS